MKQWETEVVHNSVLVVTLVLKDFNTHRETLQAQVKVLAFCALDPDQVRNIFLTIIAMVKRPAVAARTLIIATCCAVQVGSYLLPSAALTFCLLAAFC